MCWMIWRSVARPRLGVGVKEASWRDVKVEEGRALVAGRITLLTLGRGRPTRVEGLGRVVREDEERVLLYLWRIVGIEKIDERLFPGKGLLEEALGKWCLQVGEERREKFFFRGRLVAGRARFYTCVGARDAAHGEGGAFKIRRYVPTLVLLNLR